MKKLNILLVFFLINLFFIPKINAESTMYNYEIKYSETNQQKINDNLDKIQAIKTYVEQNCLGQYCPLNGSYVLSIQLPTIDTGDFLVRLHNFSYNSNGNGDMSTQWASNQYGTGGYLRFATTMYYQTFRFINGVLQRQSTASVGSTTITYNVDTNVCNPNNADCIMTGNYYWDTSYLDNRTFFTVKSGCAGVINCKEVPILISNDDNHVYTINEHLPVKDFFDNFNIASPVPSHTYTTEILDTGSVKINFNFSNYTEGSNYGYEIYNYVSGEYYGITNPYGNYPNIIPFGNEYSITIPFDTALYIRLYEYNDNDRELIDQDVIDLNNIVFENPQEPYFKIITQSKNNIRGIFENTKNGYSCYYSNSNNNIVGVVICDEEEVNETFNFNGYIDFYIENQNGNKIYSRKVNVLGADSTPYIVYSVEKQDFYSIVKWEVKNKNLDQNMKFRYSTDNGLNYSQWETIGNEYPNINVYSNTTVIIEISNNDNTTIYDSKAINVIENLETIKTFNKSSSNLINIFNNMFNVNSNILPKINSLWNSIKGTKAYLLIFIPFISSLIGGIIYLIRRK